MIDVSILLLLVAASSPDVQPPMLSATTPRSLNEFGSCFAAAQDKLGRPWSFVASDHGGVFTDYGAAGVAAPYRLQVIERAGAQQVRLFAVGRSAVASTVVEAVNRCR